MTDMLWVTLFFVVCMSLLYFNIGRLALPPAAKKPEDKSVSLERALNYAARLYADKRYLAAEKAYLEVIKLDHQNVTAYSHLGRIYMQLKNYTDAIECCRIAAQTKPSGSAYFNLGMVLYENKNYTKALAAFEKSVALDPAANRYMGLARTYQRLSNLEKAVAAYEKAVELDNSPAHQHALLAAYQANHNTAKAQALRQNLIQK